MMMKQRGNGARHSVTYRKDRGKWQARVRFDDRVIRKLFETRDEAELWALEVKVGRRPAPDSRSDAPTTLGKLYDLTCTEVWEHQKAAETTIGNARQVVMILGRDFLVEQIDTAACKRVFRELQKTGVSPSTINRKMATLSKMLTVATEEGVLSKRPTIPRMREPEGRIRFLSQEEDELIVDAMRRIDPKYADLAEFLVETGARLGEALNLSWSDMVKGPSVQLRNTKGNAPRVVPLSDRAVKALDRRSTAGAESPFGACFRHGLHAIWHAARDEVGLTEKEIVPHILRHTFATRLVMRGVDLVSVQKMLGHKDIRLTARYAHFAPEGLDRVRDALNGGNT